MTRELYFTAFVVVAGLIPVAIVTALVFIK